MRQNSPLLGMLIMVAIGFASFACSRPSHGAERLPEPKMDLPAAEPGEVRTAVFAGGCFWCVEAVFEQLEGVRYVVSGYAGGSAETAQYEAVSNGGTDHAEAVRITYDPAKITFGQLLRVFFATHDPTTKDRQGPDWGRQYRSAVFFADDDQKRVAEAYIRQLDEAKVFDKPIVTTLEPLSEFYAAEQYHQDFVQRNPRHPYVQQWAVPKVEKVRTNFPDQLKSAATQPATQPGG